jgi:hypothetical protein
MPLGMETQPIAPDSVFFPQIMFQSSVVAGQLIISATITYAAAKVDATGKWLPTGQSNVIYIPDVEHLEDDITSLSPQVLAILGQIITLLGNINTIRKVL